ncbi:MAG: hypothetical protein WBF53_15740, partial [Litorimonas sp.]
MRILILGVSAVALGACSMGGGGWSHHQGHAASSHHAATHGGYSSACAVVSDPCQPSYAPIQVQPQPVYHAPV